MRTVVGALALVGLLTLTGCIDSRPIPTLPPTPSSTPIFASDEEALAAAEGAYRAYLEASSLIANEGGANPERIAPFVTEEQLPDELDGSAYYSDNDLHSAGAPSLSSAQLQQRDQTSDGAEVVIYACIDVSAVRILDISGADVTSSARADVIPLEVVMRATSVNSILIADSSVWSGTDFC